MDESKIQQNFPLKDHNTFGIQADAALFYEATHLDTFINDLATLRAKQLPILVLGGGSNILLTGNYNGVVIKVSIPGIEVIEETADTIDIKVGAGENWHQLVMFCIERGYGGIENLALIPGQAGAAPIQNIGAYGVELKDIFLSLSAITLATGEKQTFHHADCHFGYRNSVFKHTAKNKHLITDITLRLSKQPKLNLHYHGLRDMLELMSITNPSVKDVSQAVINIRQSKLPDPKVIGNAGSFYKNPIITKKQYASLTEQFPELPGYELSDHQYKVPAGWLIEKCGFKGKRYDRAGVHDKQALVLVNHGGSDGATLANLAHEIQSTVYQKFNIQLETEVNII